MRTLRALYAQKHLLRSLTLKLTPPPSLISFKHSPKPHHFRHHRQNHSGFHRCSSDWAASFPFPQTTDSESNKTENSPSTTVSTSYDPITGDIITTHAGTGPAIASSTSDDEENNPKLSNLHNEADKKSEPIKGYGNKGRVFRSGGKISGFQASENIVQSWLGPQSADADPVRLTDVNKGMLQSDRRIPLSGLFGTEVARVLGGGLVPGSLVLICGDPGVGKSTLVLQVAAMIAEGYEIGQPAPVVYVSGEESVEQIKNRADRMKIGTDELYLYSNMDIELGVFDMSHAGLQAVLNPSEMFLGEQVVYSKVLAGLAVSVIMDGSQTFLIEIQALCVAATRLSVHVNGIKAAKAKMIIAVLMTQAGLKLEESAVFLNVVNGVTLTETAGDLAVAAAICSSFLEFHIPNGVAFIGEIGLGGELRMVPRMEKRVMTVVRLGYKKCIVPKCAEGSLSGVELEGLEIVACRNLKELVGQTELEEDFVQRLQIMHDPSKKVTKDY